MLLSAIFWERGACIYQPKHVTDETFNSTIGKAKMSFVLVSESNNDGCEDVIPRFRAAAEIFKSKCDFFILDSDKAPNVTEQYNFTFFPSVFVFRKNIKTAEYLDLKNTTHFVKYLRKLTGPPVINLETGTEAYDFLAANPNSVILITDSDEGDETYLEDFTKVAESMYEYLPFAHASTAEAIEQIKFEEPNGVLLRRQSDDEEFTYPIDELYKTEEFEKWVHDHKTPKYRAADGTAMRDIIFDSRYTLLCLCDLTRKQSIRQIHIGMKDAYEGYGDNFTYLYGDINEYLSIANEIGFSGQKEPIWGFVNITKGGDIGAKYLLPEGSEATQGMIRRFADNFVIANEILPIRSEAEPSEESQGLVRKLVGTTFRAAIEDETDDVVVLIMTGDDLPSQRAATSLRQVAREFRKQGAGSVQFYYINKAKNDLPSLEGVEIPEAMVIVWPAGKQRKPQAIGQIEEPGQLFRGIKGAIKTRTNLRQPARFAKDSGHEFEL